MDPLRIALIAFGVLLVAAVYFHARWKGRSAPKGDGAALAEPRRGPEAGEPGPTERQEEELLIVFYLTAPEGERFSGAGLMEAFHATSLQHGKRGVFHWLAQEATGGSATVFTVANILEPGYFELDRMGEFVTPGLALILHLPGPLPGEEAFARLLETAEALADRLGGELLDETRSPLSGQKRAYLREQIRQYDWRQTFDRRAQNVVSTRRR